MMFFKKRKIKGNPLQDKLAGRIANGLIKLQITFSGYMNKLKHLKLILVSFCIISGGLSIYFFVDAIVSKPKVKVKIDQVRIPKHFDKSGDEVMESTMPDDIYQQIQAYKRYMDSIGQPIRSGLKDSMRILEEIDLQQQK